MYVCMYVCNEMKVSKFSCYIVVVLVCFLFPAGGVMSEIYRVGDDNGWNSGTGANYLSWLQQYNFTVGDILVFKYSKVQHNVKEVTDATFRSCDASSGVLAIYLSGNDEITLNEARKYNFICDKDDHCLGGMRFTINVATVRDSNSNNNTTFARPVPPPPPPPIIDNNSCAALRTMWDMMTHIIAIGISAFLLIKLQCW